MASSTARLSHHERQSLKLKTHGMKSPDQVNRRNERERNRVQNLNNFYHVLADKLALYSPAKNKKFSKKETLRTAIEYIKHLERLLQGDCESGMDYPEIESPMDATTSSASSTHSMEYSHCFAQYSGGKLEPSSPHQLSHSFDSSQSSPNYPCQNYPPQMPPGYYNPMQAWKGSPVYHPHQGSPNANYYLPSM